MNPNTNTTARSPYRHLGLDIYRRNRCVALVANFFKGDIDKTLVWFDTPNPMLGNVSPDHMMYITGRSEQLLRWIETALAENQKP